MTNRRSQKWPVVCLSICLPAWVYGKYSCPYGARETSCVGICTSLEVHIKGGKHFDIIQKLNKMTSRHPKLNKMTSRHQKLNKTTSRHQKLNKMTSRHQKLNKMTSRHPKLNNMTSCLPVCPAVYLSVCLSVWI